MIAASLFSGIGAPETAMPHWQWPWHAEIEKFPSAVMAARHAQSENLGDVTADDFTERAKAAGQPNIVVFGSPCQSYSIAGKRLGLDDPRGNLALVALGIVARLEPDWFVFENVPGLLSSSEGSDFGIFLRTVDELGYSGAWAGLDAQHFGLAQRRDRLFFVGHSGDWRYPAAVLFEPEGLCGDSAPRRQAGKNPTGTIGARTGLSIGAQDADCGHLIAPPITSNPYGDHESREGLLIVPAMTTRTGTGTGTGRDGMDDFIVAHSLRADGFDASEDGTGRGTPLIVGSLTSNGDAHSGFKDEGGLIAFNHQYGGDCRGLELRAVARSLQRDQGTAAVVGSTVRRLTPRECERLQGFPDDYTAVTYRGKPAADGPRYKALGNSMAVPVLRWILERIERLERPYDAQDDMTKSLAFAYSAIRARESSKPEHDRNYDFAKRELEPGEPVTDR